MKWLTQVVIEEKDREVNALREKQGRLQARVEAERADMAAVVAKAGAAAAEAARLRGELAAAGEERKALVAKFSKLLKVVRCSFVKRSSERAALEQALEEARAAEREALARLDGAVHGHQAEQDKVD